jgi:muramoyltetrapeptide carboxypeptidase LdcA involved in peptidoglycan recycling
VSGLLEQFPAVMVALAKASAIGDVRSPESRDRYREDQREAVLRAVGPEFGWADPDAMVVFNADFGHTGPQWVLPYGGLITVDGPGRRITAHYGS